MSDAYEWLTPEGFRLKRDWAAQSGVPEVQLRLLCSGGWRETDAVRKVKDWIRSDKTFLFLSGGVGCGKSAAAAWACFQAREFAYVTADRLRDAFGFEAKAARELCRLKAARLLVVDDLGTEYDDKSNFSATGVSGLLCHRHDACLRTLVTMNLGAEVFKERYPRVADRVREAGKFIEIGGASMRKVTNG